MSAVQVPSIGVLIDRTAKAFSSRIAVSEGDRVQTFATLNERSNRLANALTSLTTTGDARVAILLANQLEFVEIDFAIAKAGRVKLPINPRLLHGEREWVLANSRAEVLFFDASFSDFVDAARPSLPDLKHLVVLGGEHPGAVEYEKLVAQGSAELPRIQRDETDPSFILYTSGTSGKPKGAVSSVGARRAATSTMLAQELDVAAGDSMIHVGSVAHGSGSKILAYYLSGAQNRMVRKWDPDQFLWLVANAGGTGSFMVPTMMASLSEAARATDYDLRSLKTISYGGAPISPARLREALETIGHVFVQVYGSCEAPHPLAILNVEDHREALQDDARLSSVGRVTHSTEIRLVGEDGSEVAVGEKGEMVVRSSHLMSGYWDAPRASAEVLRDGWYSTGDVARVDEAGFLTIVDRTRDLIISGGLNVYPAEVEAAIHEHPAVREVAVIGVPDEEWGESVKAFVVVREGAGVSESDVIEHCRERLAGYKKPRFVEFSDELPKGSSGKILKRVLRDAHWEGAERRVQ